MLFNFVMNEKSTKQLNGFNLIFLFNQLTIFAYFYFLVVIVLINTFLLLSCPNTFLKVLKYYSFFSSKVPSIPMYTGQLFVQYNKVQVKNIDHEAWPARGPV